MKPRYIITNDNITIVFKGKTHSFSTPKNIHIVLKYLKKGEFQKAIDSIDKKFYVSDLTNGKIKADASGKMTIKNQVLPLSIQNLVDRFFKEKKPIEPILKLWERINSVPDNVVEEEHRIAKESLFDYLVNTCVKITEDGCFIGYKKVREDYRDCHSGKFDNTPGNIVSQDRSICTVDRNVTCASGLHIGAWEYVHTFSGTKIVECLIDPIDVVSVPTDYHNQKMRVCRYKVIRDVTNVLTQEIVNGSSVLYEGYVEPVNERDVVKKVAKKSEKKIPILKKKQKDSADLAIQCIDEFEVNRISEDRLPLTKSILKHLNVKPGDKLGCRLIDNKLVVDKIRKLSEYEFCVQQDLSIRLSKSIVNKISTEKVLHVRVCSDGKKWIEVYP